VLAQSAPGGGWRSARGRVWRPCPSPCLCLCQAALPYRGSAAMLSLSLWSVSAIASAASGSASESATSFSRFSGCSSALSLCPPCPLASLPQPAAQMRRPAMLAADGAKEVRKRRAGRRASPSRPASDHVTKPRTDEHATSGRRTDTCDGDRRRWERLRQPDIAEGRSLQTDRHRYLRRKIWAEA